jgi:hypothetical protein
MIKVSSRRLRATVAGILISMTLLVAFIAAIRTVDAAEIRLDPSREHPKGAVLEGKIEAGDFAKFKSFILKGDHVVEIYLASPGGNLAEAMKIGLFVRLLNLSTVVPSKALTVQDRNAVVAQHNLTDPATNYKCASACFFIFVAGIHRRSDNAGEAILGIHRPSLSPDELKRLSFDQAAAADRQTRLIVENYLKAMDVPAKYANNMYAVPMRKIEWIRFDEVQADFRGFIPKVEAWADAKCGDSSDAEKNGQDGPHPDGQQRQRDCEATLQEALASQAYATIKKQDNALPLIPNNVSPLSPR